MSIIPKIAFITPESPPFSGGGIATFINNITKGLSQENIYCEVFTPALDQNTTISTLNNVIVHRIATQTLETFRVDVVPYFLEQHKMKQFNIVESCEIHACLRNLMEEEIEGLKYVIRVQMPFVYQNWLNNYYESRWLKLRYVVGALRRLKWDLGFWNIRDVKRHENLEYQVCAKADFIIAPSNSFKKWLQNFWQLKDKHIEIIYHLFDHSTLKGKNKVSSEMVNDFDVGNINILFVGKLNAHKGVVNLAKAAKKIIAKFPNTTFILIGEDWDIKFKWKNISTSLLLKKITNGSSKFQLIGKVSYQDLTTYYEIADICIFPSLWEAWGYTCTEAMSFGKPVIGSKFGGMADAIQNEINGLLVNPFSVKAIENTLERLVVDEGLRERLGNSAKYSVETTLNFRKLVLQNIDFYYKILNR
ncbi:MAG: glycosyltransferase family 4 protein [Saprospiraceae bacterium]